VPRKCNTSIYINKKIHCWLQNGKGQKIQGDMIPRERGLKGISLFIIFYLPIIDFMDKRGYMRFLGGRPCGSYFDVIL
jgi:hypothetical protein